MAEKVEVIIEAEDNASGPINKVGEALENLSSTATKENLRDFKDAGVATFGAIGDSVGQLIKIAADDQLVMMRMNAQLKALGETANVSEDDIIKLADQLSRLSGFDDEALIEGQTTLLRFGTLSKEQFEQATKAAADLAAMTGMDLVSAFRQVGVALDNPEQGFGRLKRQIGDLTEEQQAAIDKMIEMGDVAGAQGLILDALAQKVGGASEAYGETFTGKIDKATTAFENQLSAIGKIIITPLPQWLVNVGVAAKGTGSLLGPVVDSFADLALAAAAFGKGGVFANITFGIKALAAAIAAPFALAIAAIGTTIAAILALGAAIAVLIMGLKVLGPSIKQNVIDPLITLLKALWERIKFELERAADNLITSAKEKFGNIGEAIVSGIWEGIKKTWPLLLGNLPLYLYNLYKLSQQEIGAKSPSKLWADGIGKPMAEGIGVGFEEGILDVYDKVVIATEKLFALAESAIQKLYENQWDRTVTATRRRRTTAGAESEPTVSWEPPKGLTESLRLLDELKTKTAEAQTYFLNFALAVNREGLFSVLQSQFTALVNFVKSDIPLAFEDGSGKIATILSMFIPEEIAQSIVLKALEIKDKVTTAFENLRTNLSIIGGSLINGIIEGWNKGIATLQTIVITSISELLARVKALIGFGSPSKLWADTIGKSMAQGVQVGFSKQMRLSSPTIGNSLMPGGYTGGGGGGGAVNVTLVYSPAVSIASRAEAENVLGPYINDVLRQLRK